MATTQHYLWASGHFLLLVASIRYFMAWMMFRNVSAWWYKASFTGALVSYAIVCQKSLGTPQPSAAFVRRAILDENVQYFLLAFFWWTSKPIAITLLQVWVKANYDSAMRVVAYTELVIFVRVFLGAITFQNSLLSPIIFVHFLRQRYYQSAFTREAVGSTTARIDAFVRKPGNPPMLVTVWDRIQMLVGRWVGTTLTPANANGGAAAGAGAAPRR
ncbi:Nucleoporin POM33 [Mycena sanguinolenta]|uniref:Nucleoporin POM33 n=1 Tax=Mycena sanguinolenta TaxID=230812 RepID=A0A8H7CJ66_9AGAR|nr:Nucleoporin POM33 [Mycena sanguinolenta]